MPMPRARRWGRPFVSGAAYSALVSEDWSGYPDKPSLLTAWDGSGSGLIRLVGDYFGGYAAQGLVKADMYDHISGTPWPGGKGLKMAHPCANAASISAGPETGGPHTMSGWANTLTGPNGFIRIELGADYPETLYVQRLRLSSQADRPVNGISTGWTTDHDEPSASSRAQKMGWGRYTSGTATNVGSGGLRSEVLGSSHNFTSNLSGGVNWTETVTNYGLAAPGSTVVPYTLPMGTGSPNNWDGYQIDVYWYKRVSPVLCYAAYWKNREYTIGGSPLTTDWSGKVARYDALLSSVTPTGIDQWQSMQNRNGRVSPGTQYTIWGPLDIAVGAYNCAALAAALGVPGYV